MAAIDVPKESFSCKRKSDANPLFVQFLLWSAAIPPALENRPQAPCSIAG
jgi:hypothetical protein